MDFRPKTGANMRLRLRYRSPVATAQILVVLVSPSLPHLLKRTAYAPLDTQGPPAHTLLLTSILPTSPPPSPPTSPSPLPPTLLPSPLSSVNISLTDSPSHLIPHSSPALPHTPPPVRSASSSPALQTAPRLSADRRPPQSCSTPRPTAAFPQR